MPTCPTPTRRTANSGPWTAPTAPGALKAAVDVWNKITKRTVGVIAVTDSRSYNDDLEIHVRAGSRLLIVAADWPADNDPDADRGAGAPLRAPAAARAPPTSRRHDHRARRAGASGELTLDGLLLEQPVTVDPGDLGLLRIAHCTLAPETAGLTVASSNGSLTVELDRTISGPVGLGPAAPRLRVRDCIVDGRGGDALAAAEADADVQTSTIAGATRTRTLSAGNSIFTGVVAVKHRQTGCVRYCYLPLASVAARRFRCHPVDEAAADRVAARFHVARPAARSERVRPARRHVPGRDRARRRGRGRDGRVQLPEEPPAPDQPDHPNGRVPALRPGGRSRVRDLRRNDARRFQPRDLPPREPLQRGAPPAGPRPARRGVQRARRDRGRPRSRDYARRVGPSGAPLDGGGFAISVASMLRGVAAGKRRLGGRRGRHRSCGRKGGTKRWAIEEDAAEACAAERRAPRHRGHRRGPSATRRRSCGSTARHGSPSPPARNVTGDLYGVHAERRTRRGRSGRAGTVLAWDGSKWERQAQDADVVDDAARRALRRRHSALPSATTGTILVTKDRKKLDGRDRPRRAPATCTASSSPTRTHGWAVGEQGTILFYDGKDWTEQPIIAARDGGPARRRDDERGGRRGGRRRRHRRRARGRHLGQDAEHG